MECFQKSDTMLHFMCRMVYFGIFHSLLTYSCQIWGQIWGQVPTSNTKRILILQNKALRIINFAPFRSPMNPLYKTNNILKIVDIVQLQNFLFAHDYFHNELPVTFNTIFIDVGNVHSYETRGSKKHQISLPRARTQAYGINSI